MIFTWVIGPVLGMVTTILSGFPSVDTSWIPSDAVFESMAGWAAAWAPWIPWSFMFDVIDAAFLFILPAFLIFELAQWAYRELPTIAGFGPSS
jgi:hypothetical protein